jgi:hypothetical protein
MDKLGKGGCGYWAPPSRILAKQIADKITCENCNGLGTVVVRVKNDMERMACPCCVENTNQAGVTNNELEI